MTGRERIVLRRAYTALESVSDYFNCYDRANAIRFQSGEIRTSPLTDLVNKALEDVGELIDKEER